MAAAPCARPRSGARRPNRSEAATTGMERDAPAAFEGTPMTQSGATWCSRENRTSAAAAREHPVLNATCAVFSVILAPMFLVFFPMAPAFGEASEGVTLRAEGTAEGTGAEAVREADENGVLAAMGEYLHQYAPAGDIRVFKDLLERPRRYVRSFARLDTEVEDGVTVVTLRVSFDEDAIRREAASVLLPQVVTSARVLVLIAERGIGAERLTLTRDGIAGDAIGGVLTEAGLRSVFGAGVLLEEYDPDALLARLSDDTAIRALLRENAADVAVTGRASLQSGLAAAGSNLLEHRAEMELRIVGATEGAYTLKSDAKILSAELERGAETALRDACARIKDEVMPLTVLAAAQSEAGSGVLIAVRGAIDDAGKRAIVDRLKNVPGVGDVEELRPAEGVVRFYAPYTGEIGPLYRHLTWEAYQGFRLSAERVVSREVRLEAIPTS